MLKTIIGFVGSIGVALVLTALGLIYDATALLYAGIIILALVVVAWLFFWAHPLPETVVREAGPEALRAAEEAKERQKRRQRILDDARQMVAAFELQSRWSWRQMIRYNPAFAQVRPHLSDDYMKSIRATRVAIVPVQGLHDPLAARFLDELDRLEREWGLT